MVPPQKRKRHTDTTKIASENSQAPKLVPKQVIVLLKTVKVLLIKAITPSEILRGLRQDFYNESESKESEHESENNIINES
jgi:hypothetical protein